jgi:hypothetical protein
VQIATSRLADGIMVGSDNIPSAALTQDKFKDGNLPDGTDEIGSVVTVTGASIAAKSISPAVVADGALTSMTKLTGSNVPVNTVPASTCVSLETSF